MADRNSIERETSTLGNVVVRHPHIQQHWQDFDNPVTIPAHQAGDMYRAVYSIRATLRLVADHQLRINSHGEQEPRFSKTEIEAMLSGALALAEGMENALEDLHRDSFDTPTRAAA